MILTMAQYNEIMNVIDYRTPEELMNEFGLTHQIAYSLYNQNIIKYVKRNHHRIKSLSPQLYRSWKGGKTILGISREKRFPPALIATFILIEHGIKRRDIQKLLIDPSLCQTRRMVSELRECMEYDSVYSPTINDRRTLEGRRGEERLQHFLDDQGIEYYQENDLRYDDFFPKTPDILFKKEGQNIRGHIVNWIESKSNFGSPTEFRANYRKQLSHYTELFGPGIVVYWYGYVEGINPDTSITVVERGFFFPRGEEGDSGEEGRTGIPKGSGERVADNADREPPKRPPAPLFPGPPSAERPRTPKPRRTKKGSGPSKGGRRTPAGPGGGTRSGGERKGSGGERKGSGGERKGSGGERKGKGRKKATVGGEKGGAQAAGGEVGEKGREKATTGGSKGRKEGTPGKDRGETAPLKD